MKSLLLLLTITFGTLYIKSQTNFEKIIQSNTMYLGDINTKTKLKVYINKILLENPESETYKVNGLSDVDGNISKFDGEIIFNQKKTKELRDASFKIYGFKFTEEGTGKHNGVFTGDLIVKEFPSIFTLIGFEGKWENHDKSLNYKVYFDNSHKLLNQ